MNGVYWLSFVDADKSDPPEQQHPGGGGFLGVCIVKAHNEIDAVMVTHNLGINPGGSVAIVGPAPEDWVAKLPEGTMNRLLTAEEASQL